MTPRQMDILIFIRDYRNQHGYSPTMQEIGDELGVTKVTVFEHVERMIWDKHLIRGEPYTSRTLTISPDIVWPEPLIVRCLSACKGLNPKGVPKAIRALRKLCDELDECMPPTPALARARRALAGAVEEQH